MPKKRPRSLSVAIEFTRLMTADQNVRPVETPQQPKINSNIGYAGAVEYTNPSAPVRYSEKLMRMRGATRSASQPLGM